MKKIVLFCLVTSFFFGCTKVSMDSNYNEATVNNDLASLVKQSLLNEDDTTLINDYIRIKGIKTEDSVSYDRILQQAKAKKEKELRNEAIQKQLQETINFTFTRKYMQYYYSDAYLVLDGKATNKSDKDICGFSFTATFRDGNGGYITQESWNNPDKIKAHATFTGGYNLFGKYENTDTEARLRSADLDKLKIDYIIRSVYYCDGTVLELED